MKVKTKYYTWKELPEKVKEKFKIIFKEYYLEKAIYYQKGNEWRMTI